MKSPEAPTINKIFDSVLFISSLLLFQKNFQTGRRDTFPLSRRIIAIVYYRTHQVIFKKVGKNTNFFNFFNFLLKRTKKLL